MSADIYPERKAIQSWGSPPILGKPPVLPPSSSQTRRERCSPSSRSTPRCGCCHRTSTRGNGCVGSGIGPYQPMSLIHLPERETPRRDRKWRNKTMLLVHLRALPNKEWHCCQSLFASSIWSCLTANRQTIRLRRLLGVLVVISSTVLVFASVYARLIF